MAHRCLQVDSGWAVAAQLQKSFSRPSWRLSCVWYSTPSRTIGEELVGRDAGDGHAFGLEVGGPAKADVGPKPPFQQLGKGHRHRPADVDFVERI